MWTGSQDTPRPTAGEIDATLRGLGGNTETIGMSLYTQYLLPFEMVSILLLVAMIGAIYLAKKQV